MPRRLRSGPRAGEGLDSWFGTARTGVEPTAARATCRLCRNVPAGCWKLVRVAGGTQPSITSPGTVRLPDAYLISLGEM